MYGHALAGAQADITGNQELLTKLLLFGKDKANQHMIEGIHKCRIADLVAEEKLVAKDVPKYQFEVISVIFPPFDLEDLGFRRLPYGSGFKNEHDLIAIFMSDASRSHARSQT